MQIEQMTVNLRVRSALQAFDLGTQMLRAWALQIYVPFVLVMVPLYIMLLLLFSDYPLWIWFTLWFFKPLWDRIPLFVLSRNLFGETTSIPKTLSSWLPFSRPGLLLSLTLRRFSPTRSLILPVLALEGQSGKSRNRRIKVIGSSLVGNMLLLLLVCIVMEWGVLLFNFFVLPDFFFQSGTLEWVFSGSTQRIRIYYMTCWFLAFLIIEPYYVAAGFSLYINRRTNLEAWDLELLFRKMVTRLQKPVKAVLWLLAFVLLGATSNLQLKAQDEPKPEVYWDQSPSSAVRIAEDLLAKPPFQETQIEKTWQLKPQFQKKKSQTPTQPENSESLFAPFQDFFIFLAKIILVLLAIALLSFAGWVVYRLKSGHDLRFWRKPAKLQPLENLPQFMAGVQEEMQSETQVVERAHTLWQQGETRRAMSLLYRGGLLQLIRSGKVQVKSHHTERECQSQIAEQIGGALASYFEKLTHHWIYTAYAHQAPPAQTFHQLCQDWQQHLESAS